MSMNFSDYIVPRDPFASEDFNVSNGGTAPGRYGGMRSQEPATPAVRPATRRPSVNAQRPAAQTGMRQSTDAPRPNYMTASPRGPDAVSAAANTLRTPGTTEWQSAVRSELTNGMRQAYGDNPQFDIEWPLGERISNFVAGLRRSDQRGEGFASDVARRVSAANAETTRVRPAAPSTTTPVSGLRGRTQVPVEGLRGRTGPVSGLRGTSPTPQAQGDNTQAMLGLDGPMDTNVYAQSRGPAPAARTRVPGVRRRGVMDSPAEGSQPQRQSGTPVDRSNNYSYDWGSLPSAPQPQQRYILENGQEIRFRNSNDIVQFSMVGTLPDGTMVIRPRHEATPVSEYNVDSVDPQVLEQGRRNRRPRLGTPSTRRN